MGGFRARFLGAIGCAVLTAGCFAEPSGGDARLGQLRMEGEELERSVDQLEERLLGTQANLHLWQELAQRHRQVSVIATANNSEHFAAMVKMFEQQQRKKSRKSRRLRMREQMDSRSFVSSAASPGRHKAARNN